MELVRNFRERLFENLAHFNVKVAAFDQLNEINEIVINHAKQTKYGNEILYEFVLNRKYSSIKINQRVKSIRIGQLLITDNVFFSVYDFANQFKQPEDYFKSIDGHSSVLQKYAVSCLRGEIIPQKISSNAITWGYLCDPLSGTVASDSISIRKYNESYIMSIEDVETVLTRSTIEIAKILFN